MELQNSYIFLKQVNSDMTKDEHGNYHLVLGDSIVDRLERIFPELKPVSDGIFFGKKEYCCTVTVSKQNVYLKAAVSRVVGTTFLDVSVNAKTVVQCVKTMEYVHSKVIAESFTQDYIPIVSYDAVSEYFCNKAFPLLNALERNLRKLLFNTYIVHFGKEYYQITISEDIQKKAKQLISNKGGKSAVEIRRLQEFFYSLEYVDIESMLFTPRWTPLEEERKRRLLEKNEDLTKLSDQELREEISKIQPRSDWERFFSQKVALTDVDTMLNGLRISRNTVAHVKFFSRDDYNTCKVLIEALNEAIIEAIRITEDKEFIEKNEEYLRNSVAEVLEKVQNFTRWVGEKATKTVQALSPIIEVIGKAALAMYQEDGATDEVESQSEDTVDSEGNSVEQPEDK